VRNFPDEEGAFLQYIKNDINPNKKGGDGIFPYPPFSVFTKRKGTIAGKSLTMSGTGPL
jgi:hypothetical protein